jgi:hypothetical protein
MLEELERYMLLSFVVTKASDALDSNNDPVKGTLRWAISQAEMAGGGTVDFAIPGPGVHTITPKSALPTISVPMTIDGYSQGSPNTQASGDNAVLNIVLDGSLAGPNVSGLHITAEGCTVQGLAIDDWGGSGIWLDGGGKSSIEGNFIGVDETGVSPRPNVSNGVHLDNSPGNHIGGMTPAERNVISGNGGIGVLGDGGASSANAIQGNYIGTESSGLTALPNGYGGVAFNAGSQNLIGGSIHSEGNLISGNIGAGIGFDGPLTTHNFVLGNFIGTDRTGKNGKGADGLSMGNMNGNTRFGPVYGYGVLLFNGAAGNQIGGMLPGDGNVISNNISIGIYIVNSTTSDTVVQGNLIGTDVSGTLALGNGLGGVVIGDASGTTVGGSFFGAGNVISGNGTSGISIGDAGASGNVVEGNKIGTDVTGENALKNADDGVDIVKGATNNTIGGTDVGAANVISGNGWQGVNVSDAGTSGNAILGNMIGTDLNGELALGNGLAGVFIGSAHGTVVGGTAVDAGNVISGNKTSGLSINGVGASGTVVQGNKIGTDKDGGKALKNADNGVDITNGAADNTIGGTVANAGNVISGNGWQGVNVYGKGTSDNKILGNKIGTDIDGKTATGTDGKPLANGLSGVYVTDADGTVIGGAAAGAGNVVSGNAENGVVVTGKYAVSVVIEGNEIGTDKDGNPADASGKSLGNQKDGVLIQNASYNTVGGTQDNAGNLISNNGGDGVEITGGGSTNNDVQGNQIGTDKDGSKAVMNAHNGVDINTGASRNTVGGSGYQEDNVISGNGWHGVYVGGKGTSGNEIVGNQIGTDDIGETATGTDGNPLGNGLSGVFDSDADNTVIGGTDPNAGNVISGNKQSGIAVIGANAQNVIIEGNKIGTNLGGGAALGNGFSGVYIGAGDSFSPPTAGSASSVTVGGTDVGAGNVISGNHDNGVWISGAGAQLVMVAGNMIGTDAGGSAPLPNGKNGVRIDAGASGNKVGGTDANAGNVISGNGGNGVYVGGKGTTGNKIRGNKIGTDKDGKTTTSSRGKALGNGLSGVYDSDADGTLIGGIGAGAGNFISGNTQSGIVVIGANAQDVMIEGNKIGTDVDGKIALGNGFSGVYIGAGDSFSPSTAGSASFVFVGGAASGAGNVISGNHDNGVWISGAGAKFVTVAGNMIGTDTDGSAALPNGKDGVRIDAGANGNTVGGETSAERNFISGNKNAGVHIDGAKTTVNHVVNNWIGTNKAGDAKLSTDQLYGVELSNGANLNTVGGTNQTDRNVISGNDNWGVYIHDNATIGNDIEGNYIGTDSTGSAAVPNEVGVRIANGPSFNDIGDDVFGAGNVISGNTSDGVNIEDSNINFVRHNFIGTDANGKAKVPNGNDGVSIENSRDTYVGGTTPLAGNLIAGSGRAGVSVTNSGSTSNWVEGNTIGGYAVVNGAVTPLGNTFFGVYVLAAPGNWIGGPTLATGTAPGNVIAGNGSSTTAEIEISGAGATGNKVQGNVIGSASGSNGKTPSLGDGVYVSASANGNLIGGSSPQAGNLISGNNENGVEVYLNADQNQIQGNVIASNGVNGVYINSANETLVGGPAKTPGAAPGNIIRNNGRNGVMLQSVGGNPSTVQGNLILKNGADGVLLNHVAGALIGGTAAGNGNVISGNGSASLPVSAGNGVHIVGGDSMDNNVQGNTIGTDLNGKADGNLLSGVLIEDAPDNFIGGATTAIGTAPGNVISFNGGNGVTIKHATATGNKVQGNIIGAAVTGQLNGVVITDAPGNLIGGLKTEANLIEGAKFDGVLIANGRANQNQLRANTINSNGNAGVQIFGASQNTIGGPTAADENLIINNHVGVDVNQITASGNTVSNNRIGIVGMGQGNFLAGVQVENGAQNTTIVSNVIAYSQSGVRIDLGSNTQVLTNSIFDDSDGLTLLAGQKTVIRGNTFKDWGGTALNFPPGSDLNSDYNTANTFIPKPKK